MLGTLHPARTRSTVSTEINIAEQTNPTRHAFVTSQTTTRTGIVTMVQASSNHFVRPGYNSQPTHAAEQACTAQPPISILQQQKYNNDDIVTHATKQKPTSDVCAAATLQGGA
jgi:hypothetical protein